MQNYQDIYNSLFLDWEYGRYLQATLIFLVFYLALYLVRILLEKSMKDAVSKTKFDFDDLIVNLLDSFGLPFYFIISLFVAAQVLDVGNDANLWFKRFVLIAVVFYFVKALNTVLRYAFKKYSSSPDRENQDPTAVKVLNIFVEIIVWILALLLLLQNFGYNITTLLGGLGIVGIAVAFGLQSALEDIFSFFSIYFDKPFKIGDFIVVGNDSGTVKKIGIKSTRIKTLKGQELIISNKELTGIRVNNYKRLKKRRIGFEFGVVYGTGSKKLEQIPKFVEEIISKIDKAEFKRTHLKEMGESALIFETVYVVDSPNYEEYMDIKQDINLGIIKKFEKEKIELAYPTQTILLKK